MPPIMQFLMLFSRDIQRHFTHVADLGQSHVEDGWVLSGVAWRTEGRLPEFVKLKTDRSNGKSTTK
jgi:hypothetical protein